MVRIGPQVKIGAAGPQPSRDKEAVPGFADSLKELVGEVNDRLVAADNAAAALADGKSGNIHETMIALEKADISFRLLTKVQSKAVAAYQEIMRLQL